MTAYDPFVGDSTGIRLLAEEVRRSLGSDSPLLILGESGSGKGVLARWVHQNGPRAGQPFVDLNCAGLSGELVQSELFGYEKGAFTSAVSAKPGLLEVAEGGTFFLDEIGDLDLEVQAKLLTVVEERRFRRLGGTRDRMVDVRLIAATHRDLAALTKDGRFRHDLYYRINVIPVHVPALRDRREDIPALARRMLARLGVDLGRAPMTMAAEAEQRLLDHPWLGNLRELRNVLERAVLQTEGDVIQRDDLRFEPQSAIAPSLPATAGATDLQPLTLKELERSHIERVLNESNGNVEEAARRLGIPRSSLYQKLRELGIRRQRS